MKTELDLSRAPAAAPASLPSLAGMSLAALKAEMEKTGVDPKKSNMRAKQLRRWIHHFGVQDFAEMTDVAKELRAQLAEKYVLTRPEVSEHQVSRDGTQKWLTCYGPGIEGESVYIPDVGKAGALCVSSQVGCTLNCTFCHTGTQKLVRNLSAQEIVAQVLIARDQLAEWPSSNEDRRLTNIVFMGMGEPLYNLDNVCDALAIMSDGDGLSDADDTDVGQLRLLAARAAQAVVVFKQTYPGGLKIRAWQGFVQKVTEPVAGVDKVLRCSATLVVTGPIARG